MHGGTCGRHHAAALSSRRDGPEGTGEGDGPADLRDWAILMLLITYGLRAGEVAGLRLDDLDWTEEMVRVRCPKPERTHHYPLSHSVGQAGDATAVLGHAKLRIRRDDTYGFGFPG